MKPIYQAMATFIKLSGDKKKIIAEKQLEVLVVAETETEGVAFINAKKGSVVKALDKLIQDKYKCIRVVFVQQIGTTCY